MRTAIASRRSMFVPEDGGVGHGLRVYRDVVSVSRKMAPKP
jgi:hypothetical protein